MRERDLVGREGRFVAEGVVVLEKLLAAGRHPLESVLIDERRADALSPLLAQVPAGVPVYIAGQAVMDAIVGFHIHRGVLAIGRRLPDPDPLALLRGLTSPALVAVLVGLSNQVQSATVYYERHGFSARLSGRYRSSYRGDIATFGPRGAIYRNLQPETVIDAQISYGFRSGLFKNLTLIAQAYNLTDEPLVATSGADLRYIQDYQSYGPSYSVGATYKF